MERTTLPRVILVDLDPHAALSRAVEGCLGSWCCLAREATLSPTAEASTGVSSRTGLVNWRQRGIVGTIVCASITDAASERRIRLKLRELRRLPVLVARFLSRGAARPRQVARSRAGYRSSSAAFLGSNAGEVWGIRHARRREPGVPHQKGG